MCHASTSVHDDHCNVAIRSLCNVGVFFRPVCRGAPRTAAVFPGHTSATRRHGRGRTQCVQRVEPPTRVRGMQLCKLGLPRCRSSSHVCVCVCGCCCGCGCWHGPVGQANSQPPTVCSLRTQHHEAPHECGRRVSPAHHRPWWRRGGSPGPSRQSGARRRCRGCTAQAKRLGVVVPGQWAECARLSRVA